VAVIPLIAVVGAAAVAGLLLVRARRRAREAETLAALRAAWGRVQERPRDLEACRAFAALSGDPATPRLDEHTWRDLDMDQVYGAVDRTQSSPGQLVLYRWLRETGADARTLEFRDRTIRIFRKTPNHERRCRSRSIPSGWVHTSPSSSRCSGALKTLRSRRTGCSPRWRHWRSSP
jgi:hypothetical protein